MKFAYGIVAGIICRVTVFGRNYQVRVDAV